MVIFLTLDISTRVLLINFDSVRSDLLLFGIISTKDDFSKFSTVVPSVRKTTENSSKTVIK